MCLNKISLRQNRWDESVMCPVIEFSHHTKSSALGVECGHMQVLVGLEGRREEGRECRWRGSRNWLGGGEIDSLLPGNLSPP